MRRILITLLTLASLCLFASAAFAADGASLYKRCAGCHGADGSTAGPPAGDEAIKGHSAEDIEKMLIGYQEGTFGGPKKTIMQRMVKSLSKDQIKQLAEHIATF